MRIKIAIIAWVLFCCVPLFANNDGAILITKASTDVTLQVKLYSNTTGSLLTGVYITDLDLYYIRVEDDEDVTISAKADFAALSALTDAHADCNALEIGQGYYRFDIPDAAFATGATTGSVVIVDANTSPAALIATVDFQLVDFNPYGLKAEINTEADTALTDYNSPTKTEMDSAHSTTDGKIDTVDTVVDAILVDSNDIQEDWAATVTNIGDIETDTNDIQEDWSGLLTNIDDIETDTNDIQEDWSTIVTQVADVNTNTNTIIGDTNELETDWTDGGRLDAIIDLMLGDTNELETDWTDAGRLDAIIDLLLGDSNELQTDWANGGRLDLLLDAALADSNDIQEDWAALLVNIADIETDTNDIQEDWSATVTNIDDIETIVDDIQSTSGAGGFP